MAAKRQQPGKKGPVGSKKTAQDKRRAAEELGRGGTYRAAADAAGVELSTIWRWLQSKEFCAMVERIGRAWRDSIAAIAARAAPQAILTLVNEMVNGDCSVARIMAAREILQRAGPLTPSEEFARQMKLAELDVKRDELKLKQLAANPVSNWAEVWAKELTPGRPAEFPRALPAPQQEEEGQK